jgi:hypothetical protein
MNVNLAATSGEVFAGGAHVILHVTRAEDTARVHVFESSEDLLRRALCDVSDDAQAATMTHAHHEFDGTKP